MFFLVKLIFSLFDRKLVIQNPRKRKLLRKGKRTVSIFVYVSALQNTVSSVVY